MNYFLIRGDQIISTIDATETDVVALPLLGGGDAMSLMSAEHAENLVANLGLTTAEALAALGLADLRLGILSSIFIASAQSVSGADVTGLAAYRLADIDAMYSLWQVCGQEEDLLRLHTQLWASTPAEVLGMLAVVQTYGSAFYDAAVRTATGTSIAQALVRRDLLASYLEDLGHANTATLRSATTEHAQMIGIAEALGHTGAQLWESIVNGA